MRLLVDQDASAARRKGWADDAQLYRSHDFTEPEPELREVLDLLNGELDENPALDWPGMKSNQWRRYWLVRRFIPTEPTAEHPERVSDSSAFPDSEQPMHH